MTTELDPRATARALVARRKGILAADESFPTIEKRFRAVGVESTEPNRRAYREMLFSAPDVEHHLSGVILFDETIRQADGAGTPFPQLLVGRGIIPGIKVDAGAKPLAAAPDEKVTEGLDGLRARLDEYRELGARFTKWRAVYAIGEGTPSARCLRANAEALARFATLSQEAHLVPILEPEVLMDGSHPIERSESVSRAVWQSVFEAAYVHGVELESMLLKTNMVLPGYECPDGATPEQVAERTLSSLACHVPPAVPGIVFLSGGQTDEAATRNLDAINRFGGHPWELSFSYGRALQGRALQAWAHDPRDVESAQAQLLERAAATAAARAGEYAAEQSEGSAAAHQPAGSVA